MIELPKLTLAERLRLVTEARVQSYRARWCVSAKAQKSVLFVMLALDRPTATAAEVGDRACVSQSRMSQVWAALEARGLITSSVAGRGRQHTINWHTLAAIGTPPIRATPIPCSTHTATHSA